MARPANAEEVAARELKDYWEGLVKHAEEMAHGADKQFCELVKKCVDELWEEVVEKGTWQNRWQDTLVWQRIELQPGEAERRIRAKVRPWLAEARQLKYKKWWFTDGVDRVGDYVDRWFGAETEAERVAKVKPVKPAEAVEIVAVQLRDLWDGLVRHQKQDKSFLVGDNKKFYELVEQCFDELWVGDEASTWVRIVWKRLPLEAAEQERRIRENVRPWLWRARRLQYTRSDVTSGVDVLSASVDRWFGETTTKQKPTEAERVAENMRKLLAELCALVERYAEG
jgi:hypothetical protein